MTDDGCFVAWLVGLAGALRGHDYRLPPGPAIAGTGTDCAIRLTDEPFVSNRHAEISLVAGRCFLRDLNSTNGTFVNEERIDKQLLADGDLVRLGSTKFIFKCLVV